ncbi:ATP-binding protein [Pseudodesulfovibrio thermohalotolerans]|uniref:AlbA family DNA-binding domain-containing protein n=1 Tax=Pseudodesulfovibrio thermohalotolerans TaxID=2880651 RepID=UPI002442E50B|nr:ATP-binding protein [Pseudodesulfovibrio thermohalotolerans]WFS61319.1 ATP-binding protein [Pseudodesulfovibrio thermohalotolerans]
MRGIRGSQLYLLVFYGVIFTVVAIGGLAYLGVREIRHDAAVVAVENSARGLSGAVTVLLNAVRSSNQEIGQGLLKSLKPDALRKELGAVLRKHESLTAVMVSDGQGLRYLLTRRYGAMVEAVPDEMHSALMSKLLKNGKPDNESFLEGTPDLSQMDGVLSEEFNHLEPGQVNWRSAGRFHNVKAAWITASTLVESGGGERLMLSFAFQAEAILSQLNEAEHGGAERIFLYWGDGRAMPVSGLGVNVPPESVGQVLTADELVDPVVRQAVTGLAARPKGAPDKPFSFIVDGEVWWTWAMPLSIFGDTLSLGVAVPRKNVLSTLTSDSFLQGGAVVLILIAFGVLFILHRNRGRIEALGMKREAAATAADVRELIRSGEGGRLEFKQTLRFNLKAGKNGKEIEHACLKTVSAFLNTEGGTLLVGVADDGSVTGFDEDGFDSDDRALLHFNNLVDRHIGAEFSRYIDSRVIRMGEKRVLRVHCVPAPAPVILDAAKGEEFYVRSGPASRSLTLKQFYDWLKKHS